MLEDDKSAHSRIDYKKQSKNGCSVSTFDKNVMVNLFAKSAQLDLNSHNLENMEQLQHVQQDIRIPLCFTKKLLFYENIFIDVKKKRTFVLFRFSTEI